MRTTIRDNYTPQLGQYHERIIIDSVDEKVWLFDCDGVFTDITRVIVENEYGEHENHAISQKFFTDEVQKIAKDLDDETAARIAADEDLDERIDSAIDLLEGAIEEEATAREEADTDLQDQIDAIEAASDVVDVVGTYAELQAYDTSKLNNNDIVKVLQDETHDDAIAYYRWDTSTEAFIFVGVEGPYYTASETDQLLAGKQDTLTAGNNIQINGNTISATDTTYSDFVGTDGTAAGTAGLVPAPAATDADKFLKADGTWDTAGGEENATTVFYVSQIVGSSRFEFWRDSAKTDQVTQSEFITAVQDGPVMLELDWAAGGQSGGHRWVISQSSISEYSGGVGIDFTTHGTQTEVAYYTWEYGNTYATRRVNNLEFQLTAGANISISRTTQGTTISATDTTYTAGTGITIDANNVISASVTQNNINSTDWNALWQ